MYSYLGMSNNYYHCIALVHSSALLALELGELPVRLIHGPFYPCRR